MTRREKYLAALALFALACAYTAPIYTPLDAIHSGNPIKDFDRLKIAAFEHFARQSLLSGGLALWCPYFGGGYPLIAHPEDGSVSPLILPSYLFGEVAGIKIQITLVLFLGALGTFLAARKSLGFNIQGAGFASIAFLVCGWFVWRVAYGWPMHNGYLLFPFVFYFTEEAAVERRKLVGAIAFMTVILFQIAQGLPIFFLFLFLWALFKGLSPEPGEKRWKRLQNVFLLALGTAAAGAIKVFGLFRLLGQNTRSVDYSTYLPAKDFYSSIPEIGRFLIGESDVFYKNIGAGPWILLLAVLGLVVAFRKLWPFFVVVLLYSWIALGPNAPVDLFRFLHCFPVFGSMHQPMKYMNFFIAFSLCLLSGAFVDRLSVRVSPHLRFFLASLLLLPLAPSVVHHETILDQSFTQPLTNLTPPSDFRQVAAYEGAPRGASRPDAANLYRLLLQNEGTIDWDGDLLLPEYAVPAERIQLDGSRIPVPEYRGEVYLKGAGRIESFDLGVNRLRSRVTVESESAELVFNQNFDPAWKSSVGTASSVRGLLSVSLDRGTHEVDLRYRPVWFLIGAMLSVMTWIVLFVLVFRYRKE